MVVAHAGYSGYTIACWKELAKFTELNLSIVSPASEYPYSPELLQQLPLTILEKNKINNQQLVAEYVVEKKPDIVVIPGWAYKSFSRLIQHPKLKKTKFIMALDTAWEASLRQLVARFKLKNLIKRIDAVVVAGERGRVFARYIGVRPENIYTSLYGIDYEAFRRAVQMRQKGAAWPRSFVYFGRYEPIKGIAVLLEAYRRYREKVENPWGLSCYGLGSMSTMMSIVEGVQVNKFVQPPALPSMLSEHGVALFPSLREPWGVALAEAVATEMPVIVSQAMSSGVDLVRHMHNGLVLPAGNVAAWERGMLWCHENRAKLPFMGAQGRGYAAAYAADVWATRWMWMFNEVLS